MKLAGRDFDPKALLDTLEARLRRRGLEASESRPITLEGVEPRVDPAAFYLDSLETHADPTVFLPLVTHRGGVVGQGVRIAKSVFRAVARPVVNEVLGRQRLFNGYTRAAFGELFEKLEDIEARLEAIAEAKAPKPSRPSAAKKKKRSAPRRK